MTRYSLSLAEYRLDLPEAKGKVLKDQGLCWQGELLLVFVLKISMTMQSLLNSSCTSIVNAHIEVTERLGSETFLYGVIAGQNFTARVNPKSETKANDDIQLIFDMTRCHVFDKETEKAIVH